MLETKTEEPHNILLDIINNNDVVYAKSEVQKRTENVNQLYFLCK